MDSSQGSENDTDNNSMQFTEASTTENEYSLDESGKTTIRKLNPSYRRKIDSEIEDMTDDEAKLILSKINDLSQTGTSSKEINITTLKRMLLSTPDLKGMLIDMLDSPEKTSIQDYMMKRAKTDESSDMELDNDGETSAGRVKSRRSISKIISDNMKEKISRQRQHYDKYHNDTWEKEGAPIADRKTGAIPKVRQKTKRKSADEKESEIDEKKNKLEKQRKKKEGKLKNEEGKSKLAPKVRDYGDLLKEFDSKVKEREERINKNRDIISKLEIRKQIIGSTESIKEKMGKLISIQEKLKRTSSPSQRHVEEQKLDEPPIDDKEVVGSLVGLTEALSYTNTSYSEAELTEGNVSFISDDDVSENDKRLVINQQMRIDASRELLELRKLETARENMKERKIMKQKREQRKARVERRKESLGRLIDDQWIEMEKVKEAAIDTIKFNEEQLKMRLTEESIMIKEEEIGINKESNDMMQVKQDDRKLSENDDNDKYLMKENPIKEDNEKVCHEDQVVEENNKSPRQRKPKNDKVVIQIIEDNKILPKPKVGDDSFDNVSIDASESDDYNEDILQSDGINVRPDTLHDSNPGDLLFRIHEAPIISIDIETRISFSRDPSDSTKGRKLYSGPIMQCIEYLIRSYKYVISYSAILEKCCPSLQKLCTCTGKGRFIGCNVEVVSDDSSFGLYKVNLGGGTPTFVTAGHTTPRNEYEGYETPVFILPENIPGQFFVFIATAGKEINRVATFKPTIRYPTFGFF